MQKVFLISLFLVYAGILLSLFVPQLFLPVFELQRSTELQESFTFWGTRAFGFSLQPNAVTLNITMLIIGTVLFQQKTSKNLLHVFVGFFFIMLTGSRGGMLLYLLFLAIYITFFLKGISTSIYSTTGTKFQLRMKYVPILLFLAVLPISLYAVYSEISITTGPTVYDRWERIFAPQQSYLDENEDASVKARLQVRSEALRLAMQSPILGQGLGAMEESVRRGEIPISTHNTLLKYAIAYGIPYVLLYVFGLFFMFLRDPYRSGVNRYVQSNFFFQLVICILFASQIQSVLDRSIILHSMLGVAIGLKIMASKWMMKSHDEINGSLLLMNTAPQGNLPS